MIENVWNFPENCIPEDRNSDGVTGDFVDYEIKIDKDSLFKSPIDDNDS